MSTDAGRLVRELHAVLAVELVQRMVAVGTLVAIGIYAAVVSNSARTSAVILGFVVLALLHLAHAFRLRSGGELLRRDLYEMELGRGSAGDEVTTPHWPAAGPYRSAPVERYVFASRPARLTWGVLVADALLTATLTGLAVAALQ